MSIKALSKINCGNLWKKTLFNKNIQIASFAQKVNYFIQFQFPEKDRIILELKDYFYDGSDQNIIDKVSTSLEKQVVDVEKIKDIVTKTMIENQFIPTDYAILYQEKMVALLQQVATKNQRSVKVGYFFSRRSISFLGLTTTT